MKKRLISVILLLVYIAILVKVMVFKEIPTIHVGQLMLNFGGADAGHPANFVPFRTILPYLLGYKGWIIAGINLVGNIILLVPVGILLPFIFRKINWKSSLLIAAASGLAIEILQTILHVGIFDIDDVILNAFGVMLGYWGIETLARWLHGRKYIHILVSAILLIVLAAGALYAVYPHGQPVDPDVVARTQNEERAVASGNDPCGGTGGIGEITNIGNGSFTMKRNNSSDLLVKLAPRVEINTPGGRGAVSDLKIGDRATLVGGPNPDGSFTADAVFVCSTPQQEQ